MKKILFFILCMGINFSIYGQVIWNIKGGANISSFSSDKGDIKAGYQVGAGLEYHLNNFWSIESDLFFISKGAKGDFIYTDGSGYRGEGDYSSNPLYLQLPIRGKLTKNLNDQIGIGISAGPFVAVGVGGKEKYSHASTAEYDRERDFFTGITRRFDAGISSGIHVDINKFLIEVNGDWGLTKIISGSKMRNITYSLNIGYRF